MMQSTRIHVTKARPSSLEADIISPAQPKVLPGGTVSTLNCAGSEMSRYSSNPGANLLSNSP